MELSKFGTDIAVKIEAWQLLYAVIPYIAEQIVSMLPAC